MVRLGKETMSVNRRTRRTITVAAILLVLLATALGELAFGDRGGVKSAEAQVATDSTLIPPVEVFDGAASSAGESTVVRDGQSSVDAGAIDDAIIPGIARANEGMPPTSSSSSGTPGVDVRDGAISPVVVTNQTEPAQESSDDSDGSEDDSGEQERRRHGVDDHAVEHSDRHADSEPISHGRDEEAHQEHR